jgi:hypothetical protein
MHCFLLVVPFIVTGFIGVIILAKKMNKED